MDDVQTYSQNEEGKGSGHNLKLFLFIFTLVILSIVVAGFSYFLGTEFSKETEVAYESQITSAPELKLTENISSVSPTSSPSATKRPLPTSRNSPTITPTPKPLLRSKILSSVASLDGYRSSDETGKTNLEIRAGRNSELVTRGFVSFEIDEIPADADIQSATLRLYQTEVIGSPYSVCGALYIDHLTYGDTLDKTDYIERTALISNFTSFDNSTKVGWKEVDVTSRLKDDIANARSTSQYRIHFEKEVTDGNVEGDFVYFESQDNSEDTGNMPQLVVKYY